MSRSARIIRNERPVGWFLLGYKHQQEPEMKKAILVATCVAAISAFSTAGAFAQSTGPAPQQDNMSKDKMGKDGMKQGTTTTGMDKGGMSKEGMSKEGMSKDSMKKDDGMKKDGMSK
jgi:pentapeptide MXKDX repeat protein